MLLNGNIKKGFTLIELAIVLVIIGLIVGGVLVGRDLISAAAERAQIAQIEKYNTAVNTFRGKYNALPGDMNAATASQFGFASRGKYAGEGDGNGLIEGMISNSGVENYGWIVFGGETEMFWVDLTTANGLNINMVDGGFSQDNMTASPVSVAATAVGNFMPAAKIGAGNYVYVWSGGWNEIWNVAENASDGVNYFGLSAVIGTRIEAGGPGLPNSNVSLTVKQAYDIDKKIDDGLPQSGRVMAMYPGFSSVESGAAWAASGYSFSGWGEYNIGDYNSATGGPVVSTGDIGDGSANSTVAYGPANACFDGSSGVLPEQYSIEVNGGAGANCALSFRFQ